MNINELKDFYFNKRILVTGHTGFKGTWLCKVLSMFGANVYGYSLNPSTTPNIYNILKGDEWMNSIIGDIRDFERLNKCIKSVNPEYVFGTALAVVSVFQLKLSVSLAIDGYVPSIFC